MIANIEKRPDRREGGFTLIEVLVAMTLTGLILAAVSAALIVVLSQPPKTVDHLGSSDSAFRTGSTFADDISSATPEVDQAAADPADQKPAVARGAMGCGGVESLVRISTTVVGGTEVRSYTVVDGGRRLERRVCEGTDVDGAVAAPVTSTRTVVTNLVATTPPTVACRATAAASLAPMSPEGDLQCRLVSLTVTTTGNLVFTVDGRRETVQSPLTSQTSTERSCTLAVGSDTFIDDGHAGANNTGLLPFFQVISAKSGSAHRMNAYLKFDLLAGCEGADQPVHLLGGKTLTRATLQLYLDRTPPSHSNGEFRLVTLPEWFVWSEDQLKFGDILACGYGPTPARPNPLSLPCEFASNSDPGGYPQGDPDVFQHFLINQNAGNTVNVDVLGTVTKWYSGAVPNRGWSFDRGFYMQDDAETGWWFGSRNNPNPNYHPRLILEWE